MNKNLFHFFLSLTLILALQEYSWHFASSDKQAAVQLESESEASEEELGDGQSSVYDTGFQSGNWFPGFNEFNFQNPLFGIVEYGCSFSRPDKTGLKLFILLCQLRLDC